MFPAPKYQGHVEHRRGPQRQTEGGADSLRGQKGHMCQERWGDMPWAPGGPSASNGKGRLQGGGGYLAVPCGGETGLCKGLGAGILGLQWRTWLLSQGRKCGEWREHREGRSAETSEQCREVQRRWKEGTIMVMITVTVTECLLCARHCIQNFTGISCNPHHNPMWML